MALKLIQILLGNNGCYENNNPYHNDNPEKASRPLSGSARGFVPTRAAIVILEEYEQATEMQKFMPK